MKKRYTLISLLLILTCVNILFPSFSVRAELSVKLIPTIDTQILRIGSIPGHDYSQSILIKAQTNKENVEFRWEVDLSSERFQKTKKSEFRYCPPDKIPERSEWVTITVTAKDEKGESASDSLEFLLVPWDKKELFEELRRKTQKDKFERVTYLKNVLLQNIEVYQKLKEKEILERVSVNDHLIPLLLDSIEKLKEFENFYHNSLDGLQENFSIGQSLRREFGTELVNRFTPNASDFTSWRKEFEQELVNRLSPDILPSVEFVLIPDNYIIQIGSEPKEILITAHPNKENVRPVTWNLYGPGTFKGSGFSGVYTVPARLDEASAEVTIALTVVNDKNKTTTATTTLTLLSSMPPIVMEDEEGNMILPFNEVYYLKPSENVVLRVNPEKLVAQKHKITYTTLRQVLINGNYIASNIPGAKDIIFVKIVDDLGGIIHEQMVQVETIEN